MGKLGDREGTRHVAWLGGATGVDQDGLGAVRGAARLEIVAVGAALAGIEDGDFFGACLDFGGIGILQVERHSTGESEGEREDGEVLHLE